MGKDAHINRLVETVFESLADPDYLSKLTNGVGEHMGGGALVCELVLSSVQTGAIIDHTASRRISAASIDEYEKYYYRQDLRIPYIHARPGQLLTGFEALDEKEFDRSALVNDFLDRPEIDLRMSLAQVDRLSEGTALFSTILRPRSAGQYRRSERRRFSSALPLIRQGVSLYVRLSQTSASRAAAEAAFDLAADAMIVVDRRGIVHAINRAADKMLGENDRLRLVGRRIACSDPAADKRLSALVYRVACLRDGLRGVEGGSLILASSRPHDRSLILTVSPMHRCSGLPGHAHNGEALIEVHGARQGSWELASIFSEAGLSPAEQNVAKLLGKNFSLAEIAAQRRVSIETVRTQSKAIWRRLGISGQRELVRFVGNFL